MCGMTNLVQQQTECCLHIETYYARLTLTSASEAPPLLDFVPGLARH